MPAPPQFTFIPCESGATPRRIGQANRKKIRAQVMRTSWSQKKKETRQKYFPTHKAPGIPLCHSLVEDRQCCTASTFRSIMTMRSINSNDEDAVVNDLDAPGSLNAVHLFMKGRRSLCQGTGGHSHASFGLGLSCHHDSTTSDDSVEEGQIARWVDEDYLGLQACAPSCCGVDPFTSSIAPIDLRMHSYLQYYLDNVLPVLHPFEEQTAVLKNTLLQQLNRSPLALYATLSVASLRVDNYSNRYDELLLYCKWADSELPVPHSFRFKTKTVHLLLHAMENGGTEPVSYMVFALICLITYELLVENIRDAKTHFRGLRNLLRSHGGLQKICAADVTLSTISEMGQVVREMEKYAEHCVDDDGSRMVSYKPDKDALSRRLATYSRFPTLVGKAPHAPEGVDWFAVDQQSAGIVDEMVATECFWHMGCRNDKSQVLNALIGTDGHMPYRGTNTCGHDQYCYSVVHGLDKLPDWNKSKFALTKHVLSEVHDDSR